MKDNQKHLTLSYHIIIEQGLTEGLSFNVIASKKDKDPLSISIEVQKHQF